MYYVSLPYKVFIIGIIILIQLSIIMSFILIDIIIWILIIN